MSDRVVGDYQIEGPLGQGAMGQVWRAVHRRRGVRAAVKMLPRDRAPATIDALNREIQAIGRLDHPHIVALYDQGSDDGAPWLAMELADGTLQAPRTWSELRRVLDEVLAGLAAAHAAGLLHLDIKPSNVLVRDGVHLLADFGIAHGLSSDDDRGVWGSPAFMAPEAFDGRTERLTRTTDLYSTGCLGWTLATGAPPFAGSPSDLADAHRTVDLPPLAPRIPVPPGFDEWLATLLRKRPTERFQSASAARQALQALPDVDIVDQPGADFVLGPTLTTCTDRQPVRVAELEPLSDPPTAPRCPPAWPPSPPIDGWARGCGLVGVLAVPWLDRPAAQAMLWQDLRALYDGLPATRTIGGTHGSGRSRLLGRFLTEAHRFAGAEPLLVEGDLGEALRRTFGSDPETLALRFARRTLEVLELARLVHDDPAAALLVLPSLLRAPLVVGVDGPASVPDGVHALVVRVVDGQGDVPLLPLGEKDTRRLLAAWASLDPQAVADVCDVTEGDLDASVALVAAGIRDGSFQQSERGWRPLAPEALQIPADRLARWAADVAALRARVDDDALGSVAVLRHPGEHAWSDGQRATMAVLAALGWLHDGEWTSSIGRRALLSALGDLTAHHVDAADHLERWDQAEQLFAAGRVDEAARLFVSEAWREAAKGRMSRVQAVLRRLEAHMAHVPTTDPFWGDLHTSLARLGPTHQGYALSESHAHRALALARAAGHQGRWRVVARHALGHLLFHADIRLHPAGAEALLGEYEALDPGNPHGYDLAAWVHLREGDAWRAMREAWMAGQSGFARQDAYRVMVSRLVYWIAAHQAGHPEAEARYARHSRAFLDAGYLSAEMDAAMAWGDMLRRDGRLEQAAERYAHALRVASEGEARADAGPFLGSALCERALGRPERALELLRAARLQLNDAGPSWEALIDLYEAHALLDLGGPMDVDRVVGAIRALDGSGYLDPDVLVTWAALRDGGIAPDVLGDALDRGRARIERFRAADAARGPMPQLSDDDPA